MHEQVLGKLDLTREVEDDELMEIILSVRDWGKNCSMRSENWICFRS